jgi:ABC-type branched-subunit amino acid transport system substrate-binding protein
VKPVGTGLLTWPCRTIVAFADFLNAAAAAKLDLPLYGGDALADVTLSKSVSNTPGATLLPRLTVTAPNPGQEGFAKLFDAFDNGKTPFSGFAATAYDAMVAMLQALQAAGRPYSGKAVLQQLLKQKFAGACSFCTSRFACMPSLACRGRVMLLACHVCMLGAVSFYICM